MPKKRILNAAPIGIEMVDWLLDGCVHRCDDADPLRTSAVYGSFIEFDSPGPDLAALWRQHRAWLLAEWVRRGGIGQPWGVRFELQRGC